MPVDKIRNAAWQRRAYRLRAWLLTEAGVMLILGVTFIIRGLSYLDLGDERLYHIIDVAMPLWLAAVVWTGVGAFMLIASVWPRSLVATVALSTGVAVLMLWGTLFLFAPHAAFPQRGALYVALACTVVWLTWRGKRGEIRVIDER